MTHTNNNGDILRSLLAEKSGAFYVDDPEIISKINQWPKSDPSPVQLLEVLDMYSSKKSAKENVVNFLRNCYHVSLEDANVDHGDVVKFATWR